MRIRIDRIECPHCGDETPQLWQFGDRVSAIEVVPSGEGGDLVCKTCDYESEVQFDGEYTVCFITPIPTRESPDGSQEEEEED